MKYLLYYDLNSKFVTDQTNAGGDGTNVVSVVDGVAWTNDQENTYYRYANNDSENLTSYTITVHYVDIDGNIMDIDDTYTVTCYKNKKAKLFVPAKAFSGYAVDGESAVTLYVSSSTEYSFIYANPMRIKPLTFKVISGGTISFRINGIGTNPQASAFSKTISYSKDNGVTWNSIQSKGGGFSVEAGDTIQFIGNNYSYSPTSNDCFSYLTSLNGSLVNIEGNIESLRYGADFANHQTMSALAFKGFFMGLGVLSAEKLFLPPVVESNCYSFMFSGCTSLIVAPELPATALTDSDRCYFNMFARCISLKTPPELPATSLGIYCYSSMFSDCTSLITAPKLPATTLATACYSLMFNGCTNLTTAPELPAMELTENCYYGMFKSCTKLNYINCLATNISAKNCTYDWTGGVSKTGTFVKNSSMTSWTSGINGIPANWTVQDATS